MTRSGGGAPDGTVDGNDPWYWFVYNEGWQTMGTFRGSDANPKERFIYHGAGLNGIAGSSYLDDVVCIDRDLTNGWAGAADGTLETRWYINQNWRGDVAVVTDDVGVIQERTKYSAYGVPTCLASADYDRNGVVNSTDDTKFQADVTANDPLADFNFDGAVDFFDYLDFTAAYSVQLGSSNGRGVLNRSAVGNRFGYAGYQWDPAIAGAAVIGGKWHVRHRVLDAERGTWLKRDPLGYHEGEDLYEYVHGNPVNELDPSGLIAHACLRWSPKLITSNGNSNNVVGVSKHDITVTGIPTPVPVLGGFAQISGTIGLKLETQVQTGATNRFLNIAGTSTGSITSNLKATWTQIVPRPSTRIGKVNLPDWPHVNYGETKTWEIECVFSSVRNAMIPYPVPAGSQRGSGGNASGTIKHEYQPNWGGLGSSPLTATPQVHSEWEFPTLTGSLTAGFEYGVEVSIQVQYSLSPRLQTSGSRGVYQWECECDMHADYFPPTFVDPLP